MNGPRRAALATSICVTVCIGLAGCAADGTPNVSDGVAELRLGHGYQSTYPVDSCGTALLAEQVAEATDTLDITVYPAGTIGNENDMLEQVVAGELEMAIIGPSYLAKWYEPIDIFEAPYMFDSAEDLIDAARGDFGEQLWEKLRERAGIRVLDTWLYGTRDIMSTLPGTAPTDYTGTKVRTPSTPMYLTMGESLGAVPTPMSLGEVYMSLQQGVIESVEGPLLTARTNRFEEVIGYVIRTGHVHTSIQVVINEESWQSLEEEHQQILTTAYRELGDSVTECLSEETEALLAEWEETGDVEVLDADLDAFRHLAAQKVEEAFPWTRGYRDVESL